ncbi:hypothetical protein protein [Babesia ovis]|uniref:Uncharacterized protein n=1 Tax=Babesia ovis TaxID=5869 RepID=A0A9W5T8W8_BABOV|nr:hypothetical protein protein [Babesia ovis]
MMRISRKIYCAGAALALCLFQVDNIHVEAMREFQLKDFFNLSWLDDMKPSREKAKDIEFEAFDQEKKETTDEEEDDVDIGINVGVFGGDMTKHFPPDFRRHYCYFILFCLAMVQYAIIGKRRNEVKVEKSLEKQLPLLKEHFAHIADGPRHYERIKMHKYRIYASGRTSCDSLTISFNLIKRQCPWHEFFFTPLFASQDVMIIDVAMPKMDPIAFAISDKLTNKQFIKRNDEVANTMHVYDSGDLPRTHRAYINSTEKCAIKYATHAIALCQEFMPQLIAFYVVDEVPDVHGYQPVNKIQFIVKLNKDTDLPLKVLEAAIKLADYTKNFNMADKTKEAIQKSRKAMLQAIYKDELKKHQEGPKTDNTTLSAEKLKKLEKKQMTRPARRVKVIR